MARPCPACDRPNADAAGKCLYCSEPLAPVADAADVAPALPEAPANQRHLLILIPMEEPTGESRVRAFSRIAGIAPYDARLSLQALRPRLFRLLDGEGRAREISRSLAQEGIAHYVVSEDSVLSLPVVKARRVALQERHLEIDLEPHRMSVPGADLLIAVVGEITRERHDEKRLGTRKGVSRRLSPNSLLHLYTREATVAVEVDPERFDWTVLGPEQSPSTIVNMERLVSRIQELSPQAEVDRGFKLEPVLLSRADEERDLSKVLADNQTGRGALYDNEGQFRYYARWRYRLARHLSKNRSAQAG